MPESPPRHRKPRQLGPDVVANSQRVTAQLGALVLSDISPSALYHEVVDMVASTLRLDMCCLLEFLAEEQVYVLRAETG